MRILLCKFSFLFQGKGELEKQGPRKSAPREKFPEGLWIEKPKQDGEGGNWVHTRREKA